MCMCIWCMYKSSAFSDSIVYGISRTAGIPCVIIVFLCSWSGVALFSTKTIWGSWEKWGRLVAQNRVNDLKVEISSLRCFVKIPYYIHDYVRQSQSEISNFTEIMTFSILFQLFFLVCILKLYQLQLKVQCAWIVIFMYRTIIVYLSQKSFCIYNSMIFLRFFDNVYVCLTEYFV